MLPLALAVALLLPAAARADTFTVTSLADSGPGTLRDEIAAAPDGSTIDVPAGTITLTTGHLVVNKSLTVVGAGEGATVISGGGLDAVMEATGSTTDLGLSQLTLRDGKLTNASTLTSGAALHLDGQASAVLSHVAVTNNVLDRSGGPGQPGGISDGGVIASSGGQLTIEDSSITGNKALANGGSGRNGGIIDGGVLYLPGSGAVTIARSDISGNDTEVKGGQGPSSSGQNGGISDGTIFDESEPLTITASTISGNVIDGSGGPGANGGIIDGGGLFVEHFSAVATSISDTTIAGNIARGGGDGGGIFSELSSGGSLSVTSSTVANNSADGTGNVDSLIGSVSVGNSIVSGGQGASGLENCSGTITSLGHNIDSLDQCAFDGTGDQVDADPLLGPLQDNGGPGATLGFGTNSPAFDRGDPGGCPATDERGVTRPQGAACDVGAFELELANLGLTASASSTKPKLGSTFTLTFAASNAGTGIGHATAITTALPAGLTLVSGAGCTGTATIACALGELGAGATRSVQIVLRPTKPGTFATSSSIASQTIDLSSANNSAGVSVTVGKLTFGRAKLTRKTFRLGKLLPKVSKVATGTTIRFTLPEAAKVKLSFARKRGKHFRKAGSFTVRGHAGVNKLRFQGRLSRHKTLKPGRYRLTMRATDSFGNHSANKKLSFRLLPPR